MTVQRADKAFFFTKDNCIDKTYELEKGIKMFPSIFIEGAAASGKTVAVKMFLEKQKDINFALFFMEKNVTMELLSGNCLRYENVWNRKQSG